MNYPNFDIYVEFSFCSKAEASESELEDFVLQLEIYSSFESSENVVRFYGVCAVGGKLSIQKCQMVILFNVYIKPCCKGL